jgi:hypothetical protein
MVKPSFRARPSVFSGRSGVGAGKVDLEIVFILGGPHVMVGLERLQYASLVALRANTTDGFHADWARSAVRRQELRPWQMVSS